jgi:hypothetical protein
MAEPNIQELYDEMLNHLNQFCRKDDSKKRSFSRTAGNVREGLEYTDNIFITKHNSIEHKDNIYDIAAFDFERFYSNVFSNFLSPISYRMCQRSWPLLLK